MDRLQAMKTFVHVVDEGGFTAAARKLGVDQALVTRQVAALEQHLGIKLLERTTRKVRLTEAGDTYLVRCRDILMAVGEAEAEISRAHHEMAGRVRLALPTVFNMEYSVQQLAELHDEFPDITVDVVITDRPVDPVREDFDVVHTYADYDVSVTAVARDFMRVPYVLCAAPAWVERHAEPAKPADLSRHFCIAHRMPGVAEPHMERWLLKNPTGITESVELKVALSGSTHALVLEAVRTGMGLGRLPATLVSDEIANGGLVPLLTDWDAGALSFKLVYPGRKMIPRRVRYVIDAIFAQRDEAYRPYG